MTPAYLDDIVTAATAWPCGYCRVNSLTQLGDRCPCCGRSKALPWWRMRWRMVPAADLASQTDDSARSSTAAPLPPGETRRQSRPRSGADE